MTDATDATDAPGGWRCGRCSPRAIQPERCKCSDRANRARVRPQSERPMVLTQLDVAGCHLLSSWQLLVSRPGTAVKPAGGSKIQRPRETIGTARNPKNHPPKPHTSLHHLKSFVRRHHAADAGILGDQQFAIHLPTDPHSRTVEEEVVRNGVELHSALLGCVPCDRASIPCKLNSWRADPKSTTLGAARGSRLEALYSNGVLPRNKTHTSSWQSKT